MIERRTRHLHGQILQDTSQLTSLTVYVCILVKMRLSLSNTHLDHPLCFHGRLPIACILHGFANGGKFKNGFKNAYIYTVVQESFYTTELSRLEVVQTVAGLVESLLELCTGVTFAPDDF